MSEKKESGRHLLRAVWFALGRLLTFLPARDAGRNGHFEQMLGFFATREDVQALAGDWQRVGADLHKAMGTYRHAQTAAHKERRAPQLCSTGPRRTMHRGRTRRRPKGLSARPAAGGCIHHKTQK